MQKLSYYYGRFNIPKTIWGIFFVALVLRFWGIWYGLPLQLNVDEPSLVSGTLSLKENLNPGRFDWPSLYFYINAVFYGIFSLIKPLLTLIFKIPDENFSSASFFIISRSLSAVLGSLTVIIVYFIARKIFSHKVGIIAALLLTFLPIHVYESHLAKIDIAHTFFVTLAVYFIWNIYKAGSKWSYLISGILIGLATSIKYNSFLLAISVLLAYLLRRSEIQEKSFLKKYFNAEHIRYMLLAGILSIVVFYMVTPFALIDYETFFSTEQGVGAMWQFQNVGQVEWPLYSAEVYETFVTMFRGDLGFTLWVLFSVLLILFLFFNKRGKEYTFLLLPTVILTFYISRLDRSPSHYFLMLIPFYIPALAKFICDLYEGFSKMKYLREVPLYLFVAIILLPSFWSVLKSNYMLSRQDTRNLAYNWAKDNLDENKDFLFVIGEELSVVEFKRNETLKVKKLDREGIDYRMAPFFVLIGVEGVNKSQLLEGDRDPGNLEGNSEPILKYADLLFSVDNDLRFGPPIHIFKVNQVEAE